MEARLATAIGKRYLAVITWGGDCAHGSKVHRVDHVIKDILLPESITFDTGYYLYCENFGQIVHCEQCAVGIHSRDGGPKMTMMEKTLWDSPSGNLEPGDLFWADYLPDDYYWDNHKGPMLFAVLPSGVQWSIDSRAVNCTEPNERTHRCWVRHGEPPNVHVDKNGRSCSAGAGSIGVDGYHGFLHHGKFTKA